MGVVLNLNVIFWVLGVGFRGLAFSSTVVGGVEDGRGVEGRAQYKLMDAPVLVLDVTVCGVPLSAEWRMGVALKRSRQCIVSGAAMYSCTHISDSPLR